MPYPTILPQGQLANHIINTWLGVNAALLYLNNLGFDLYMPTEIPFDQDIIDQVQQIPILTNTVDTSNQTTTHGETVNTTDNGETEYASGDLQTGLQVVASGVPGADNYIKPPVSLPF